MNRTRRSILRAGLGVAAAGTLAGCLSDPPTTGDEAGTDGSIEGYASFFALWDWASEVGGDTATFENPINVGEMGHGWSPDGDLTRNIASSDVFVYLDTPEFSWAQDVASTLRDDHDDVHVIDGLDGMGPYLLPFDSEPLAEPDYDHEFEFDDLRLDEFDIFDLRSDDQLGYWHNDHWHGGIPDVPLDGTVPVGVVIVDDQERVLPLGDDEEYAIDARIAEGEPDDVVEIESRGDHVEFHGRSLGETAVVLQLRRDGDVVYETDNDPTGVEVVERVEDGASEFHDPHVWTDPVLAQRVVDTIADELAEIDPDNAETFAENAAAYNDRLEEVHEEFQDLAENASRDVAVFAGHDAFQYLERRYDFELRTPVGVSPDAAESIQDIDNMIRTVEEHDIETILYDPFEAPDPDSDLPNTVELLLENTDATDAAPITPAEGTTPEWEDNGWGWVEQMEEITIPSLRQALDA